MEIPPISAAVRCLLFAAPLIAPLHAQDAGVQIAWASDAFATNLMADGSTTFGGAPMTIHFELGAFKQGFDPTVRPQSEWASNWVVLQGTAYDPVENQFIQTATLSGNTSPFEENSAAYIWGFTTKDTSSGTTAEWIVLSASNWKWPSAAAPGTETFSVSDVTTSSEILMGSVNGVFNGTGYHMMLERVSVVVPEPSGAAFAGLACLALLLRRKR
jgi:hypothetical protein